MELSNELLAEFVKITNDKPESKHETTHYGTVVRYESGRAYVQLDGSDSLTPVSTTVDTVEGERVTVLLKDHTATITGNASSPAARKGSLLEIDEEVTEVGTLVAGKVDTADLLAATARIGELEADTVVIHESLAARKAEIDELQVNSLTVDVAKATYATIADLEVTDAYIKNLDAEFGDFQTLTTNKFAAINGSIENFDATYANIDFSNIGKAAMGYFYAQSGLIKDVVVGDQTITGELVGVTINGDRIIGNTVIADKLVIKGSDGIYYKLNTDGVKVESEQTDENSLNGQIIKAKSITATKISVNDLVAFDATIGGFNITNSSLYSGVKESVGNTTRGIYLDKDGQVAFGDSNNFFKYYKDTDGKYKLAISADSLTFSSGTNVGTALDNIQNGIDNIEIGGRNLILKSTIKPPAANKSDKRWTCYGNESEYVENYKDGFCAAHAIGRWTGIQVFINPYIDAMNVGDKLTFSVNATNSATADSRICFYLMQHDSSGTRVYVSEPDEYVIDTLSPGESKRVYYTYTLDQPTVDLIKSGGTSRITLQLNYSEAYNTYFYAPKLERGNKPTDWTPAPEDIDAGIANAVDAIEIGSRNLLRNTKTFNTVSGHSAVVSETYKGFNVRYLDGSGLAADTYRDFSQFSGAIESEPSAQYTFSFYAKGSKITTHLYDGVYGTIKTVSSQGITETKRDGRMDFTLTNTWQRYWVTYTLEATNTLTTSGRKSVLFRLYGGNTAYICGCKFEKSNKPTDWTPAPEDVDADIAAAAKTATNFMTFDSSSGLQIGNKTSGSWSGFRTQITSAAFNILNAAGTVLASYGEKLIELGKNATDAVIKLCGGKGRIEYITDSDTSEQFLQVSADKLRLKSSQKSSLYSTYTNNSSRYEKSAVNTTPVQVDIYASECIDPTLVEKVEGWSTSGITVDPDGIDIYAQGDVNISADGDVIFDSTAVRDSYGQFHSVTKGTSGIWTYKKYANGDLEMWGSYAISNMECTTAMGNMYRTIVFSPSVFPFTVYNPVVTASYESEGYGAFLWATTKTTTAKPPNYYLVRPTSTTIANGVINFHVFGKWKT